MQTNDILSARLFNQSVNIKQIQDICKQASQAILTIYAKQNHQVNFKSDGSPVTNADLASHEIITRSLQTLTASWPVLSEEAADIPYSERSLWDTYWLVDPLDGTKAFVNRTDDFSINIALISQHRPVFGMVYIPVQDLCYFGGSLFHGAWRQRLNEDPLSITTASCHLGERVTIAISRNMSEQDMPELFKQLRYYFTKIRIIESAGAIKGCMVADGSADIYPRPGTTCEWDTAAFQAIVEAAGGQVVDSQGKVLEYNKKTDLFNSDFYVTGDLLPEWKQFILQLSR